MENYTKQFIWLYFHHAGSITWVPTGTVDSQCTVFANDAKKNQQQQHETKKLVD